MRTARWLSASLVESSPLFGSLYLSLSHILFVSFSLVWPGNGSFFFVPGNFPLYGLHNRYISSVCGSFVCKVCLCVCETVLVCTRKFATPTTLPSLLSLRFSRFEITFYYWNLTPSQRKSPRWQEKEIAVFETTLCGCSISLQSSFFFRLSGIGVIGARRVLLIISKSPYTLCAVYLPNAKYFVHFPRFLALTSLW